MNDGDKPVDRTRRVLVGLCLLAAIALIIAFTIRPQPSASPNHKEQAIVMQQVRADGRPIVKSEDGYVGSDSCRECHEHYYDTWYDSYHRTMTQVASRQTSAASFDDVEIEFADPATKKVTLRDDDDCLFLVIRRGRRLRTDCKSDDQRDSGEKAQSNENTSSTINGFVAIVHETTESQSVGKRPQQPTCCHPTITVCSMHSIDGHLSPSGAGYSDWFTQYHWQCILV